MTNVAGKCFPISLMNEATHTQGWPSIRFYCKVQQKIFLCGLIS